MLLQRRGNGGFTTCREPRQPDGETLLAAKIASFDVCKGRVPCYVPKFFFKNVFFFFFSISNFKFQKKKKILCEIVCVFSFFWGEGGGNTGGGFFFFWCKKKEMERKGYRAAWRGRGLGAEEPTMLPLFS